MICIQFPKLHAQHRYPVNLYKYVIGLNKGYTILPFSNGEPKLANSLNVKKNLLNCEHIWQHVSTLLSSFTDYHSPTNCLHNSLTINCKMLKVTTMSLLSCAFSIFILHMYVTLLSQNAPHLVSNDYRSSY